MAGIGASCPLALVPAKVSSPNDRGHSGCAAGTGLHAPKRPPGPVMDSVPKHGKVPTWRRSGSAWFSSRAHACAAVADTIAVRSESAAAGEHPYTTRSAIPANGPAIAAIYNEGIADRVVTLETEPRTSRRANGKISMPGESPRYRARFETRQCASVGDRIPLLEGRGELLTSRLGQDFE